MFRGKSTTIVHWGKKMGESVPIHYFDKNCAQNDLIYPHKKNSHFLLILCGAIEIHCFNCVSPTKAFQDKIFFFLSLFSPIATCSHISPLFVWLETDSGLQWRASLLHLMWLGALPTFHPRCFGNQILSTCTLILSFNNKTFPVPHHHIKNLSLIDISSAPP